VLGFVTGGDKTAWLKTADISVLPSYYENFGIAVAEAMAVGTPVVISNQVHIWEDVQQANAGWICECDVTSLTTALRDSLQDSTERSRRGDNARKLTQSHYSWDAIAGRMITAYGEIKRPIESPIG
jgi:glycosyltransferase involved in cell wall biosynthesis